MTGTTPLGKTTGKSFGDTLGELFASAFDADAQKAAESTAQLFGKSAPASYKTTADQPLPFAKGSADTTTIEEFPFGANTAQQQQQQPQLNTATLPQPVIQIQPPPQPVFSAAQSAPKAPPELPAKGAPAPDTNFLKTILKDTQPDSAPASSGGAVPLAKAARKDAKEKDAKEKDTNQSQTTVAVPVFTPPLAQNDDTRLLRLSIERKSSDGKSPVVNNHVVLDAPSAAPESHAGMQASPKSPVAFEVTIPKTPSAAVNAVRPAASSSDYTRSAKPDVTPSTGEAKPPAVNTVVAPVHKTAAHPDNKSQNGKQQPAETPEANAPAPAAKNNAVAESVLRPASSVHSAHDANAAAIAPTDVPTPHAAAVSGSKSTGSPSGLSQTAAVSEPPKIAAPRLHSIDLKVGADAASQVDVRVSQRAGDVQVTVRTADGNLAQSLRQHLPELSDRLAQNGVSGEIWHPATAAAAQTSSDTNSNSQDSRGGTDDANSQRQSRHSNGEAHSDQQEQGRGSAWRQELSTAEKEGI